MAKEKRLIDALPLMKNGWHLVQTGESNRFLRSMSLADIPTVDAVEVVRCKDCKCFEKMTSNNSYFCNEYGGYVKEEDYCSRAQPKRERSEGE